MIWYRYNMDQFLLRQTQMKYKLGLRNGQWDRSASYKEAVDATLAAWKDTPFDRWESTHSQVTLSCHLTVVETALLETICVQNMTKTTFLLPTSNSVLPIINSTFGKIFLKLKTVSLWYKFWDFIESSFASVHVTFPELKDSPLKPFGYKTRQRQNSCFYYIFNYIDKPWCLISFWTKPSF